jgi:hypothetical protein
MPQHASLTARRSRLARVACARIVWLLLAACGDGTGPERNDGDRLVPGRAVEGTVGGAERREAIYNYVAPPGQVVEVEFQSAGDSIGLTFERPAGDTSVVVRSDRPASDTTTRWIGFTAPPEGMALRLRVASRAGGGGFFRMILHAQDRNPESRSALLEFDTVILERIDSPIDVDVYRFTLAVQTEVIIAAQLLDAVAGAACFTVRMRSYPDSTVRQGAIGCLAPPGFPFDQVEPIRSVLPPGQYQVIVDRERLPSGTTVRQTPRYRLLMRGISMRPEGAGNSSVATYLSTSSTVGSIGYRPNRAP